MFESRLTKAVALSCSLALGSFSLPACSRNDDSPAAAPATAGAEVAASPEPPEPELLPVDWQRVSDEVLMESLDENSRGLSAPVIRKILSLLESSIQNAELENFASLDRSWGKHNGIDYNAFLTLQFDDFEVQLLNFKSERRSQSNVLIEYKKGEERGTLHVTRAVATELWNKAAQRLQTIRAELEQQIQTLHTQLVELVSEFDGWEHSKSENHESFTLPLAETEIVIRKEKLAVAGESIDYYSGSIRVRAKDTHPLRNGSLRTERLLASDTAEAAFIELSNRRN